jgi:hypothetical protein
MVVIVMIAISAISGRGLEPRPISALVLCGVACSDASAVGTLTAVVADRRMPTEAESASCGHQRHRHSAAVVVCPITVTLTPG